MDNKQKAENKAVSFRLPGKIKFLISILSEKFLISKTAVVILAILHFAESKGTTIDDKETF